MPTILAACGVPEPGADGVLDGGRDVVANVFAVVAPIGIGPAAVRIVHLP